MSSLVYHVFLSPFIVCEREKPIDRGFNLFTSCIIVERILKMSASFLSTFGLKSAFKRLKNVISNKKSYVEMLEAN